MDGLFILCNGYAIAETLSFVKIYYLSKGAIGLWFPADAQKTICSIVY